MSQTMNPNARRSMPGAPAPGMQLYDAPNCDYEPPKNFQQNFGNDLFSFTRPIFQLNITGNPYDCPEGFYNGSMMSSQGYSQVHNTQNVIKTVHKQCCSTVHKHIHSTLPDIKKCTNGNPQVSDYQAHPGMQPGMQGPGMPGQQMMLPGQILAQQAMMQQVR